MVHSALSLLLITALTGVRGQSQTNGPIHFSSSIEGRLAFVVEDHQLPWSGEFDYLSSTNARTALLTVADSSTGIPLGECSTNSFGDRWEHFSWTLTATDLLCTVSSSNSSRVHFTPARSESPRSFSVRIQASRGPRCMSSIVVEGERPSGCPPRLARQGFSFHSLQCGCPEAEQPRETPSLRPLSPTSAVPLGVPTTSPVFPRVQLGGVQQPSTSAPFVPASTLHPCIGHPCANGGSCVVNDAGFAKCECVDGFAGRHCESDVCAHVPCGNGGRCSAKGTIAACHCPPHTTGLLCETVLCDPMCSNGGECQLKSGRPVCDCPDGFTGPNCNVVDPCVGDAACALFGPEARCLIDESSVIAPQARLVNASYECKCPQKNDPEWIDCIMLHTSTTAPVAASTPLTVTSPPRSPITAGSPLPPLFPNAAATSHPQIGPIMPAPSKPDGLQPNQQAIGGPFSSWGGVPPTQLPPTQHQFTFAQVGPQVIPGVVGGGQERGVFPSTDSPTPIPRHEVKITLPPLVHVEGPVQTTEASSEEASRPPVPPAIQHPVVAPRPTIAFPTPGSMPIDELPAFRPFQPTTQEPSTVVSTVESTTTGVDEDPFERQSTIATATSEAPSSSTQPEPQSTTEEVKDPLGRREGGVEMIEETTAEAEEEEPTTTTEQTTTTTSTTTTARTTTSTEGAPWISETPEEMGMEESAGEEEIQPTTTTQRPSSETAPTPIVLNRPRPVDREDDLESEEEDGHLQVPSGTDTRQAGNTATASWIVAIVAVAVLGLLLLASALVVLRYIRQSRKLHGKYNPAREEHALSTAYAMPMNAVAKEERLI